MEAAKYRRLALILDDEASQIGELALRLVRLGVDSLYANDFDESVLLARQEADDVGAVIVPSNRATVWLPPILKRLKLPPVAVVPTGERPDDATVESLRSEGVRWALWTPDDDRALRFVVTAAMSETDFTEARFNLRVPTDLAGSVQRGPLDRPCVIHNLCESGALVALDPVVPVQGRITLRLGVGDASLSLRARVAWSTESSEVYPPEPSPGMGVRFDDVDAESRSALSRILAAELQRFRL
jgi:hypothetical protein